MPRINIYIRDEDWEIFRVIEDRPAFLHDALLAMSTPVEEFQIKGPTPEEIFGKKSNERSKLCSHGILREYCGRASCKKH